jgi:hypothetical protein
MSHKKENKKSNKKHYMCSITLNRSSEDPLLFMPPGSADSLLFARIQIRILPSPLEVLAGV